MASSFSTPHCVALAYLRRGWAVIPIPPKSKAPIIPNWPSLRLTFEDLPRYFHDGCNVGVLLGEPSGWLCDIDLDCPEALQIADYFLPQTSAVFGRRSKPRSHRLYYCPNARTTRFEHEGTIVEIRSTGAQTIFPNSTHPSGEEVRWDVEGEPVFVNFATLKRSVAKLASCVLLARHYPSQGSRQFAAMALAGWLLRNGWNREETAEFLEALCTLANDEEARQRIAQIKNTAQKIEHDLPVTGLPTLCQYYPEDVLRKIADWLELRTERHHEGRPSKPCTDLGNAERLVEKFGHMIRYVPEWGWLIWDGKRWVRDTGKQRILKLAEETVRGIYTEASNAPTAEEREKLARWAVASESRQRIQAMVDLAAPMVLADSELFDRDPFLLNCNNGVVNLRTGELLPHSPEYHLTKLVCIDYRPEARCPRWEQFLRDIFLDDTELIHFVQKAFGYSITGDVREDVFFVCWGTGRNGKSTLLGTVQRILADYAKQVAPDVILRRSERGDNHPTGIADLCGVRFALAQETEEGRYLAGATVKAMTGRDRLKARFMRQDYFEFTPTHKLWLATNHKPVVGDTTVAMWSRIRLIPFHAFFPPEKCDKALPEKLWQEREGILAWLVQGCLAWQREGLNPPKVVVEATEEYRSEMDVLQRWVEERCVCDPKAVTAFKDLYEAYETWCKDNDETPLSKKRFGDKLTEKGFVVVVMTGNKRGRKGLRLRQEDESPNRGGAESKGVEQEAVNAVNDVNHVPVFSSESLYIEGKYRKYVNMINSINSTDTPSENPLKEEGTALADTASHAASVPFVTPEVSLSVTEKRNNVTSSVTGKRCSVCLHPERTHIEEALQSGVSLRQVAKRFGVCYASIYRHQKKHMGNSSEPSLQSFDDWPFGERGEEYVEVLID